jgi:2-polyprenyl-6-methoxyphenol hydroxylase-like FAD-dependent oxidoreductase
VPDVRAISTSHIVGMAEPYDVIVVGARCAGSPTAMLLARKGHRVLLVDRAKFPSDTLSTHLIHAPGIAALERWGLREALAATGCPSITRYSFDFGPLTIAGTPRPSGIVAEAYGPRRTVIDPLLLEAAARDGAEVRQGFDVDEVILGNGDGVTLRGHAQGGKTVTERARVVIGADGRRSMVAKAVEARQYNERPPLCSVYYAYWSGVPAEGFEVHIRERRAFAAWPTHDDLTLVVAGWPEDEFEANRGDIEGTFLRAFDLEPAFAARVRAGTRETRFRGAGDLRGFFRTPYGPGWGLVGDAGHHKHPITAMGMTDAFVDAERIAGALDDWLSGRRSFDDAMGDCHRTRDEQALAMYDMTSELAALAPAPPELQTLLAAAAEDEEATRDFVSVQAGTLPVPEFFDPDNVERILARAR